MKRYLGNVLALVAALLYCTCAVAAQSEPCRLERAVAPDYGGVLLGMKASELAQMFPGSEDLQKAARGVGDPAKPFVASLGGLELGVRKAQFVDANELLLTFLNGTLQRIDVRYRQPVPWNEVTEFSAQASKRLAVPADSWSTPSTDAEQQSRALDCRGFSIVVRIDRGGPSTLSIVDTAATKQEAAPVKPEPAPPKRRPRKGRGGKG